MTDKTATLVESRRAEIVDACAKLYGTMSFKDITIKVIGSETTFTRTSIYNYFQSKEEIFLALLSREWEAWEASLKQIMEKDAPLSHSELAGAIAHSLEDRTVMLKLLAMNLYDIEANSRLECLVEFKKVYARTLVLVEKCLVRFCPDRGEKWRKAFLYSFFPFVFGIYPYTAVSEKQHEAMQLAGVNYEFISIFEIAGSHVMMLLGTEEI